LDIFDQRNSAKHKKSFYGLKMNNADEIIKTALLELEGITADSHRFGGTEYRYGKREIGHVHGNYLVDIPFPKKVRNELVSEGLVKPHHILPESGWVSFYIKSNTDVEAAIRLLKKSYELAVSTKAKH
jgi:predicted DNA-binding protein (MmcQ/YjbR family)